MSRYEVDPLLAVGLEGTFGFITTAVAMPILHLFVRPLPSPKPPSAVQP